LSHKFRISGHIVPKDSLSDPKVVPAGKPARTRAGKPIRISRNSNTIPVGISKRIKAGKPQIRIPGQNSYSLPLSYKPNETRVLSGNPEIIIAKEPHIMENTPKNLSSFGKLQGLKSNIVYDITQDYNGNIWLGTEGGLTKYDGNSFTHYTKKQGLCNNIVLSLLYDKNNNLWIGTKGGGISKFDGKSFTNYSEKESISNKFITSILEDKKGNIWFSTDGGAIKYDGKTFTHYTENQGLANDIIYSLYEDKKGNIWFATDNGVSKFDGHAFANYSKREGLKDNIVVSINQDKHGDYWFGTKSGAMKFDGDFFYHLTNENILNNSTITSIFNDNTGKIWFSTWHNGIYRYDLKSTISVFSKDQGLINNDVNCVFQDQKGIIWFGTNSGGVVRYYGDYFDHFTSKQGLSPGHIQCIANDRQGNTWIGTWGGGVFKFSDNEILRYTSKEGLINNDVRSLLEDNEGNLWFGTWKGVSKFDGKYFTQYTAKDGLENNVIVRILQDNQGNIWFSTEGKGVSKFDWKHFTHYNTKSGLSGNNIKSMIQDKKGNIWFGTENGITKIKLAKNSGEIEGSITHFSEKDGLPNNNIVSILEDKKGNIWFGSMGGGIAKYDGQYLETFTDKDGLFNNDVMSLLEDKKGNIWIGTRTSISKLDNDSQQLKSNSSNKLPDHSLLKFKNYKYEDGFFGIGCNTNSLSENKKNEIWIGANDRLTILKTDAISKIEKSPNIQLTDINLFNEKISWTSIEKNKDTTIALSNGVVIGNINFDGLTHWYNIPRNLSLQYYENFITFNFIGITTHSPQEIQYIYKLDGFDDRWSNLTKLTSASYGNLDNGEYTFRVKAMNIEGYWSNEYIYKFIIRPPWWKTKLAYSIYTLFFILGIILVDRIQTNRVIKKEREKTRDRELEQAHEIEKANKTLQSQINIIEDQKVELEKQKLLSDNLLLNILPSEVAEELKAKGYAEVKYIKEATVLFADFINFTSLSEKFTPNELVAEIHECFSTFDHIMNKYNIEKIKTVGDSYIAAGGLPLPFEDSALNTVKAGLEMQDYIIKRTESREKHGLLSFNMRLGIHTGPLVAGIVGVKKFQYDIWGDTVNTANRIETCGESGKVNISGCTYEIIKDHFICNYRGKITAKGKGEIDMYFVQSD